MADDVLYRSVLNAQEHSDWKKMISLLEGLVVRHSDFFRIRYNLMAGKVNEISERYAGKNYTPTTEALKNDTAFLEGVEKEFQYIKHLAPYNYDACRPEQEVIFMNQVTRLMLGNWHKLFIGGRAKKAGEKQIAGCARPYYQLKIQLRNMRPSFYRTLLVDPSETFFGLHCRIQEMF